MNYERLAMIGTAGVVSVLLVVKSEYEKALLIVLPLITFLVGERNGERKVTKDQS